MACFIDTCEAEVAVLTDLTIFCTINNHWLITRSLELGAVCVTQSQRDRLSTKPVTNVVSIPVYQSDTDRIIEYHLQVGEEIRVDEITSLLEGIINVVVGLGVIEVDAEGILYKWEV